MDKKWIVRILCGILAAIMLLGIIPFSSFALESQELLQAELDRAEALGLPTDNLDQRTVTGQEMSRLLDHLVYATDGEKLTLWKAMIPNFRAGTAPITRFDAMVAIFLAAEVLGEDYLNNDMWYEVHSTIGEKCWDTIFWSDHYFDTEDAGRPAMEWELIGSSYFYSFGRYSLFSGKYLFDYDEISNSMRTDHELTYQEAVLAVCRMFDSISSNLSAEREEMDIDKQILADAKAKYQQIMNTESDWTLAEGGKVYYVSPNGDDNNDGLSPETAWKTLDKVNSAALEDSDIPNYFLDEDGFPEYVWAAENRDNWADLNPGDVVLFERGGLWRGMLRTKSGVTYSAYGEGPKPEIWGSPENGAGAEKWSLMPGTDNIWVFYKELQDCGGILLGEDTVAIKKMAFWDDESRSYLDVGNNQQFENDVLENAPVLDLKTLEDLYFFNYIEYSNPVNNIAPEFGTYGTLYLRCDAGNPGEIYDSIEFFTGNNNWNQNLASTANGVTLDNLSFRYGSAGVSMQSNSDAAVRNCCIRWVGGITLSYDVNVDGETMARSGVSVSRTGDGIMAGGTNNSVKNCYIFQTFDWAITVEEYASSFVGGVPEIPRRNIDISENLIEYCGGGVLMVDWYAMEYCVDAPTFTDVTIQNNQILYSAMTGWAHIEDYENGGTYLAALGLYINPGVSGILVKNNVLYISDKISRLVNLYTFETGEEVFSFAGNTYVQLNFTEMLYYEMRIAIGDTQYTCSCETVMNAPNVQSKLEELLYEEDLQVAAPSIKTDLSMSHSYTEGVCGVCGAIEGDSLGHAYGKTEYTWSEDGKTCTAKRTCSNDAAHEETATATVTSEVTKDPTCESKGETTYTATFDVEWAETQTKTVEDVSALGHAYGEPVIVWNEDNTASATVTCANDKTHMVELEAKVTSETTEGDCKTKAVTTYTAAVEYSGKTYTDTKTAEGALGEHAGDTNEDHKCDLCDKVLSDCADKDNNHKCDRCGAELSECEDKNNDHRCDLCGAELSKCADKDNNHKCDICGTEMSKCADTNPADHSCDLCGEVLSECVDEDKDYKCDICGKDLEKPEDPEQPTEKDEIIRLAGDNRFDTAIKVADQMKEALGVAQFDAVILANGYNFADALAGSYLSAMKQAPILLTWNGAEKYNYLNDATIAYVKANLKPGGTVYILGGTSAVPASIDEALKEFNIQRMDGANRFETNLMILEEAGIADGSEILVCTSTNFADSLSASAAGKPILLVFNESGKLYGKQPEFLAGLKNCTFTIIGGESAVSQKLADAVGKYGTVTRLAGKNRFETSVLVAEKYFPEATSAVLAYAWDFPDGLCGGGLAYAMKAPLILTMTKYEAQAADYIQGQGIKSGVVLGGEKLISAASVDKIFGN